ncbi:MAG: Zn-dependent alcohol dehydrogenase [Candidatus Dormibacteria bacterium]
MIDVPAIVADACGGSELTDIQVGDPGPGEVMVKLRASGVCHTDADIVITATRPLVLGHEGAGEVIAVGPGVTAVEPGARVLLTWAISCGECAQCLRGNKVLCLRLGPGPGGHASAEATARAGSPLSRAFNLGTMSALTVVREEAVVRLLDGVPFTSACLMGCAVMTGYGSVFNVAHVAAGDSVVVLGAGGVGLNVIQSAKIAGARSIIAVDLDREKLDMARRFGATETILARGTDVDLRGVSEQVWQLTGGQGADHAFECTAVPRLATSPLLMVRNGGTAVAVSGVEEKINADMRLFEWDKLYVNPLYGRCDPAVDFGRLQQRYLDGELMLDELVREEYPLDDAHRAFRDLRLGAPGRGVLVMPG